MNVLLTRLLVAVILVLAERVMVVTAIIPIALPVAPVLPVRNLDPLVLTAVGGLVMG